MVPRLGVNIDHIATLRQLRGTPYPSLVEAAHLVKEAGASQLTIHLREDRRHIQDKDVVELRKKAGLPINLELALSEPIIRLALRVKPAWVCFVPEKRQELTTEGGLNLKKHAKKLKRVILRMKRAKIKVSLFVEPSLDAVKLSSNLGADAVELHTGRFCIAVQSGKGTAARRELDRIRKAGLLAKEMGVGAHVGHGFDYENVRPVVELDDTDGQPLFEEYNIGHSIVCRAASVGMGRAVREMVSAVVAP